MNQLILNATVAMALCYATTMAENGNTKPARPKPFVTESARTTFPLGPVEELPEVRKHLLDLCADVRIGLEPDTLDKLIQSSVDPAPARKTLSKEAGAQITKFNAEFRRMLRKEAGVVVDAFFDDMKNRAPKTATVTAWASHPEGGFIPYSWQVEGLQGRTSISHKAKQPVVMRKTLRLKVPGEDAILEMPLKWNGTVSIDADWNIECADHVTGVINTPKTEVRAQRWCRPKLNVDVRCEWPLSAGRAGANHQDAPARVTGNSFEEWGTGIGLNCRAGKYVIPLKAGKSLVLDQAQEAPHAAIVQEWKGFNAAQEKPKKLVVKDQKAWKDAWVTMKGNIRPKPEPPKVDFGKHEVIVVFMGRKMTGGYAVKIVRVYDNDKRMVTVKETSPPPDGMVTMALTSPYHAVVVPKTTKAVEFTKN